MNSALAVILLLLEGCASNMGNGADVPAIDVRAIVDEVMQPVMSAGAIGNLDQCIGAVVTVVTPEQTLVAGYGATEANGSTPPDGDTLFQIGSISKVFTGLALARVVARGDMLVTDAAPAYLAPDLETPLGGSTITLANLLTHHAGLPSMPSNLRDRDGDAQPDASFDQLSPAAGYSRTDLASYFNSVGPPSAADYVYSNVGIGLLGLVMQDDLGISSYHTLLSQLVTNDLGMNDTWGLVSAMDTDATRHVVKAYAAPNGKRVPGKLAEMGVLAAAGEIATTGNDMALLLSALTGIHASPIDDAIGLAVAPLAPGPAGDVEIGYAIEINHLADGDRFVKGGATPSFTAYMSFRRDPAVGVIVMTSCGDFMAKSLAIEIDDRVAPLYR